MFSKTRTVLTLLSLAYLGLFSSCVESKKEIESQVLFSPQSDNWTMNGDATWEFEEGEWIAQLDSGGSFLMTKSKYDNFELNLEFKPDSTINSGIYVRCKESMISATDCYEFNIWDLHPNQDNRTGSVVTRATPLSHVETLGKWNSYRIIMEDSHLQAWVNDRQTVDLYNEDLKNGYIAIQAAMNGEVRFRNMRLTSL